jgi:hypothetical protein
MKKIKGDAAFDDEERFVLKLPFTSGGQLKGKRVTCKTAQGYEGIVAKLREYLNNTDVMGFIPYVILQPRIRDNTEAKVSTTILLLFCCLLICNYYYRLSVSMASLYAAIHIRKAVVRDDLFLVQMTKH